MTDANKTPKLKSANDLREMKHQERIAMLTAYSFPMAKLFEASEVPVLLVGDSLGMVELGFDSTRDVTMNHMLTAVGAVRRGAPNTHVVGDLPYQSYDTVPDALTNAKALVASGADSVKVEGPCYAQVRALVNAGIAVVGHTGLTPQTAESFKQVGKDHSDAQRVAQEAKALEEAGCFMVVLEHIPENLAGDISEALSVPTIGIGAGQDCDGQVLVANDMLGLGVYWPPFSKQFTNLNDTITQAARAYCDEVQRQVWPQRQS